MVVPLGRDRDGNRPDRGSTATLDVPGTFTVANGDLRVRSAYIHSTGTAGTLQVSAGATMSVHDTDSYGIYLYGNAKIVNNGSVSLANDSGYTLST